MPIIPSELPTIRFELTINKKEYVLIYKDAKTANFAMRNICPEYETIKNNELQNRIVQGFESGVEFFYEHIHHWKTIDINKEDTLVNLTISDIHRRSHKE